MVTNLLTNLFMELKRAIFWVITFAFLSTSCKKETHEPCVQPPSQQLLIQLKDSNGNFIQFPNKYFKVSDSINNFYIETMNLSSSSIPNKVLDVRIDYMIVGYPYLIEFDSLTIDTLAVYWSLVNTTCENNVFYHKEVDSFIYNDKTIYGGYTRTIFK